MRKICKFCLMFVAILASTNVWGQTTGITLPVYAKISAQVSSKCPDGGLVYVYSSAWVDTTDWQAKIKEERLYELCGDTPIPQTIEEALDSARLSYVDYPVHYLYDMVMLASTQPDTAWLAAFPNPGYYFKGWSKVDNDYDLGAPFPFITASVLTQAFPQPVFKGEKVDSVLWPQDDQIPSIGTFYATFKPVLVNACVDGDNQFMGTEDGEQDFYANFSTSFASQGKNDFAAPVLTNAETAGGRFVLNGDWTFTDDNEVKVPLQFIPNNPAEGVYSCQLKVASKGGSAITATIKMNVEKEPEYEAMIGSQTYPAFEEALVAANSMNNAVITLSKNVDVETPQTVIANMTIDLNGKVLKGTAEQVLIIAGGKLTLVDSKKIGYISHMPTAIPAYSVLVAGGEFVMDGGSIELNSTIEPQLTDPNDVNQIMVNMAVAILVSPNKLPGVTGPATFTMNDGRIYAQAPGVVGGVMNNGGTATINAGEIYSTGYQGVLAASNMPNGTLNILGGNLQAELKADFGAATMGYGVLAFGGTVNIEKAKIIAKAGDNLSENMYGVYCLAGTTTISKKATIGIEYTKTSDPDKAHCCIGAMHVEKDMATATLDGAKLYAHSNINGYTEEFSGNSAPTINAAYFPTRMWLDTIAPEYFVIKDDQTLYDVSAGKEYLEGYRYFLGSAGSAKDNGTAVCKIGNMGYATLEDALFYAQNNPEDKVIITMVNDYTLPAGWYTLPSNASLLVPYCAEQTALMGKNVKKLAVMKEVDVNAPEPYRTLTIAEGVHLDVYGSIEASGMQRIQGKGTQGCAVPDGPCGYILMKKGSEITLNEGAHLYAWGYVYGEGEIIARKGCTVHEDFQVYDWPGGENAVSSVLGAFQTHAGAFPIMQYFMQNVECPVTYHPGSHMYASFGATALGLQVAADEIGIVGVTGENAMFLMDADADQYDTWVRKYYDPKTDQQVYEVNSSAHLGSMVIDLPIFSLVGLLAPGLDLGGLTGFDTKTFVLPITSNMKLHLLSGMMDITQNTEFLPGSELEVNKTATMIVRDDAVDYDGRAIFDDDDDWLDDFACDGPYCEIGFTPSHNGAPGIRNVKREKGSDKRPVGDAKLNVHGTFQVEGHLLTTPGGATIFSNNDDAGTIVYPREVEWFGKKTGSATLTDSLIEAILDTINWTGEGSLDNHIKDSLRNMITVYHLSDNIELQSATLLNTEGQNPEFAYTGNNKTHPRKGESYCFVRDRWTKMKQFNDKFAYDNYHAWYVKPGEYVAIATTTKDQDGEYGKADANTQPLENADHTYSDANGEGRLFIFADNKLTGLQCWEVVIEDNLYRSKKTGVYYYYDEEGEQWLEQSYIITWQNFDGSELAVYDDVYYGTMPKYNGKNPSREEDEDYTYTFTGWTPEIVPVHEDAIYTATYERSPRKYTVIFEAENGEEIERHFYTKGEMPECEDVPHKVGYYLQWEPSLGAVKGDATYRATFLPEKPDTFAVTFVNYDGKVLKNKDGNDAIYKVHVDAMPKYDGPTPVRESESKEYTYKFAGCWTPELKPVDAAITYTAVFNEKPQEYEIKFFEADGVTQIGETQNLPYGAVPTAPEYPKPADDEFTYTVVWNPTITAVTEDHKTHTYTAHIDSTKNKYIVTVNAIGCVVEGAGAYVYGKEVTLHIAGALEGYKNPKWEDGKTDDKEITVTGDTTFRAIATPIMDNTLVVGDGETITLTEEQRVVAFTIKANSETSGQIINADQYLELTGAGKAYFEYTFDAQAMKWYAFAVPFVCDANNLRNATRTLTPGVDYDIMEYNGAIRAGYTSEEDERSAWEYISDKGINVLTPGHLYMILFAQAQSTVTFTKTASASINYTTPVTINQYPADDDINANWNGVANPKLFYANLGTGVEYGQIYNGGNDDSYTPKKLSEYDFPVGKPVFVQAQTQSQVEVTPSASSAPLRRMLKADKQECEINLMQGNKECDNLSIIMNDEAEDRYVIGEDLAKAGVSTKVAQMWVNRYNAKLCVNSIAAEDEVATYPLGIFAPKAGAYTIAAASVPANTAVYLTEDDNIIADLTMPYTLDLSKGTHNEFGLRMVGKTQPSVVTDFQEAGINGKDVQKVIKNNTLYILRADKVFNAQGQLVK